MADIKSKEERSKNMAAIRAKNTEPELKVRSFLHKSGLRFRLHKKDLPGKPDIVLPRFHTIVFIHGCFWHMHRGCKNAVLPRSNRKFWKEKLLGNVTRDKKYKVMLKKAGWKVIVVWECQIGEGFLKKLVERMICNGKKRTD